jgi:hypothetical protein
MGGPVSKIIESAVHSVLSQCSVSRALDGSSGFPAAVRRTVGRVAAEDDVQAIGIWAFRIGLLGRREKDRY